MMDKELMRRGIYALVILLIFYCSVYLMNTEIGWKTVLFDKILRTLHVSQG